MPRGKLVRRYAALLRGVSPMNCKMPELKRSFEAAGFTDVKTVLSSGNVVFNARPADEAVLAEDAEAAMQRGLGRSFPVIVRSIDSLVAILASDPFAGVEQTPETKQVVTFLKDAPAKAPAFPIELDGACILGLKGCEIFTSYVPSPRGPAFMRLIEKTFGKNVTTRTWGTVEKVARA